EELDADEELDGDHDLGGDEQRMYPTRQFAAAELEHERDDQRREGGDEYGRAHSHVDAGRQPEFIDHVGTLPGLGVGSAVALVVRPTLLVALSLLLGAVDAQLVPLGTVFGPVPVATVTDGDTLVVTSNAGPRIVRLIGVDAPEPGQASTVGAAYSAQATAFLAALTPVGAPVWLELDQGATDTYGRLLAYLYVEDEHGEWVVAER